jgi:hypothetical protein
VGCCWGVACVVDVVLVCVCGAVWGGVGRCGVYCVVCIVLCVLCCVYCVVCIVLCVLCCVYYVVYTRIGSEDAAKRLTCEANEYG